jgi:hypothetical protein
MNGNTFHSVSKCKKGISVIASSEVVSYRHNKEVQQLCGIPHLSEWQTSKHNTGW